jgi:hypothetical protein
LSKLTPVASFVKNFWESQKTLYKRVNADLADPLHTLDQRLVGSPISDRNTPSQLDDRHG